MKKIIFVAGLPRSGSTLLLNILAQNPTFHCTPTSNILGLMLATRSAYHDLPQFKNLPEDEYYRRLRMVLANVLYSFYYDYDVVFDKNRLWTSQIEMLNWIFGKDRVKIIAPVRNPADIVTSFELLWRHSRKAIEPFLGDGVDMSTLQSRFNYWISAASPLGSAYNHHKDAVQSRGHDKQILQVRYESLISYPADTISRIYAYISELPFDHQFDRIEQVVDEDDRFHGYIDLHKIKENIEKKKSKAVEILGETLVNQLRGQDFWNY